MKDKISLLRWIYLAIIVLLTMAVWNPDLQLGNGPVEILLLLDESDSVDAQRQLGSWFTFLQWSRTLPAHSSMALIRFADRARIEIPWLSVEQFTTSAYPDQNRPPRSLYLDSGATAIGEALEHALRYVSAGKQTAIVLASDGFDTESGGAVGVAEMQVNERLSLFFMDLAENSASTGPRIESVNLPERINAGQVAYLGVGLHSATTGKAKLRFIVNERQLATLSFDISAGERKVLPIELPVDQPGLHQLHVELVDDQDEVIDRWSRALDARGKQKLLVVSQQASPAFQPLAAQGWAVEALTPAQLPVAQGYFDQFNAVILNDIEAGGLTSEHLDNLQKSVSRAATGLVVIGGPNSFGSGGYRHSTLESMLPLVSESALPQPGAAFLFLLDKSGSMEAQNQGSSRISDALRAVSESARSLRAGDESALLVFDRDVNVLLPLQQRVDAISALDRRWTLQASGGTQLFPALTKAIDMLATSQSKQRYLVLVTDGFVDSGNLRDIKDRLIASNIQLIAVAIGDNDELSTLRALAGGNGGQVLRIDHSAQLPRFMRQQLEEKQQSWQAGPVDIVQLSPASSLVPARADFSPLPGYQKTRAKRLAQIHLSTLTGEPLLATGLHGAGRVAALPGGTIEYRSGSSLLPALTHWVDSHALNPRLQISHRYDSGLLSLTVDAVDGADHWLQTDQAQAVVVSPDGTTHIEALQMSAPGRYSLHMQTPSAGLYSFNLNIGDERTLYSAYLASNRENSAGELTPWLDSALQQGKMRRWTEDSLARFIASSRGSQPSRPLLASIATMLFLLLILLERSSALKNLQSRFFHRTTPSD